MVQTLQDVILSLLKLFLALLEVDLLHGKSNLVVILLLHDSDDTVFSFAKDFPNVVEIFYFLGNQQASEG